MFSPEKLQFSSQERLVSKGESLFIATLPVKVCVDERALEVEPRMGQDLR